LNYPNFTSWVTLFNSQNDQALIVLTGLNHETFDIVLQLFAPIYYSYSPWIGRENTIQPVTSIAGRKRLIDATTCLGLYLAWTRTRGSCMILQMIFGLTGTPLSTWLRFARRILIMILHNHPLAAIRLPTRNEIQHHMYVVHHRHEALVDVWCTVDGICFLIQSPSDRTTQNAFYSGKIKDTCVLCIFVFCPDGTIPICCYNSPGSFHDS
jgi:hypothetical protein